MGFLVYIVMGPSHLARRQVASLIRQQSQEPCYVYTHSASPRQAFDDVDEWFGAPHLASMVTVIEGSDPAPQTITQLEHSDTVVVLGNQMATTKRWVHVLAPDAHVCTPETWRAGRREFKRDRTPFLGRCYASLRSASTLPPLRSACDVTEIDAHSVCFRAQRSFSRQEWQQLTKQWPKQVQRAFGVVSIEQRLQVVDVRGAAPVQMSPTSERSSASELVLVGDLQTSIAWAERMAKMVWTP